MDRIQKERLVKADGTVVSETPPTLEERVNRLESAVFPIDQFIKRAVQNFDDHRTTFADLEVGEWFRDPRDGDLCQRADGWAGRYNAIVFSAMEACGFRYDFDDDLPVTRVPNPLKGLL